MRARSDLDFRDVIFPVVGATGESGAEKTELDQLCGTAFSIGNGFYMTAGHVVEAAKESQSFGLAYSEKNSMVVRIAYAASSEVCDSLDVAVVQASLPRPVGTFPWSANHRSMLTDVQTFGFPHGHDPASASLHVRAFKGYVVSVNRHDEPPASPRQYELSFLCPSQMSGAPLIGMLAPTSVIGIVAGNRRTEIPVYEETERVSEEEVRTFTLTQAAHFGIAQATTSLATYKFDLLGGTVFEHMRDQDQLVDA